MLFCHSFIEFGSFKFSHVIKYFAEIVSQFDSVCISSQAPQRMQPGFLSLRQCVCTFLTPNARIPSVLPCFPGPPRSSPHAMSPGPCCLPSMRSHVLSCQKSMPQSPRLLKPSRNKVLFNFVRFLMKNRTSYVIVSVLLFSCISSPTQPLLR